MSPAARLPLTGRTGASTVALRTPRRAIGGRRRSAAANAAPFVLVLALAGAGCASVRGDAIPRERGGSAVAAERAPVASPPVFPALPTQLASFGAARSGEWIYVYGGHLGPTHSHSADHLAQRFVRARTGDASWEELPFEERLQSPGLVGWRGTVIRVGGLAARNAAGAPEDLVSSAAVRRYDPASRTWTALPDLPEPRSSHGVAVAGNALVVAGGWTMSGVGTEQDWPTGGWMLDLADASAAWRPIPEPPFPPRRAVGIAASAGCVVLLGGMTQSGEMIREAWLLDLAAGRWTRLPDLPFGGFGCAAAEDDGVVYASGSGSAVHRIRPAEPNPAWRGDGSLSMPRSFHQIVAAESGALVVLGGVARTAGSRRGTHSPSVEAFVPQSLRSGPEVAVSRIPYPGAARNRQGVFLHGDSLWCFGGNSSLEQHDFAPERFLDEGFRIDLASMRTEPLPPFPVRRQTMQTVVLGGAAGGAEGRAAGTAGNMGVRGLAIGGFGRKAEGTGSYRESFSFDFETRAWTPAPPLSEPRTQFQILRHADRTFVFGGMDFDSARGGQESFRYPLEVLEIGDSAVSGTGIRIPRPRRAFGAAVLDGKAYLVGGMREGFAGVPEVDAYDFGTKTWTTAPAPTRPRISPHVIAVGGRIFVLGGTARATPDAEPAPDPSVEAFDPATGAWERVIDTLPVPVSHLRCFAWRDRILCLSLHSDEVRDAVIAVIRP